MIPQTSVNWTAFNYKYSTNPQHAFESLTYYLFCHEFQQPYGIFRYFNQPHIETNPIHVGDRYIGFQSKYYADSVTMSSKEQELIGAVKGAVQRYPGITTLYFYISREFSPSSKTDDIMPSYQKKVEAAWYKMTSLIGRILGIEKGTDEYVKAIQKTIEKNGIAVSLEEVAADEKSLWVAYSLTDENDENDISMNSVQAAVDGEALALERQYALNNSTGSEKTASKYFVAKFNRSKADRSQKFEIEIGTFQNENGQVEEKDAYEFSFTADPEVLEADTKEIDIQTSIPIEKNQTFLLSEMKYNIFGCTISGSFSDMAEDDEFWIRGKDDLGNEYVFDLTSYEKPNLIFELENLEIPNHAKQLTLQLYHFSGTAGEIVSYEQKESEDAYIEEIGTVYGENQAPEDLAVPVGESITVDLQK